MSWNFLNLNWAAEFYFLMNFAWLGFIISNWQLDWTTSDLSAITWQKSRHNGWHLKGNSNLIIHFNLIIIIIITVGSAFGSVQSYFKVYFWFFFNGQGNLFFAQASVSIGRGTSVSPILAVNVIVALVVSWSKIKSYQLSFN